MELLDQVALITGAGSGIGRAVALGLAREGAHIGIIDIDEAGSEALKREIEETGRKALAFKTDVSNSQQVQETVKAALNAFGRTDILVNCAGIISRTLVEDMSEEIWDRTLDVNLKGTFLFCKEVLGPMREQKTGRIVNFASGRGIAGQMRGADYSASKGGVIAFTKSLALEVAEYGINVNAVAPGQTDTAMWRKGKSKEEIEEKLKIPRLSGGIGKPEHVVGPVLFLVTDASKYITGQVIFMKTP